MLKKVVSSLGLIAGLTLSAGAFASACDDLPITVIGATNIKYTIDLSKGSLDSKTSKNKNASDQVSPAGSIHHVFSNSGTGGDVAGTLVFSQVEGEDSIVIPFQFNRSFGSCHIYPNNHTATSAKFQVQISASSDTGLLLKVKEFK